MPSFTVHRHPVLAVPCPVCGAAPGSWCRQSNGQRTNRFHIQRRGDADLAFIEQHGWTASIERDGEGWIIDPRGRASIRPQPAY